MTAAQILGVTAVVVGVVGVAVSLAALFAPVRSAREVVGGEPLHPAEHTVPADLVEPAKPAPRPVSRAETERRIRDHGVRWWNREFAVLAASAPELNTVADGLADYYLIPDSPDTRES